MSVWRVEVRPLSQALDVEGARVAAACRGLGVAGVRRVDTAQVFFLHGDLSPATVAALAGDVLSDPLVQSARWFKVGEEGALDRTGVVEVSYHPGVTDALASTVLEAAAIERVMGLEAVETARRYEFEGDLSAADLRLIAEKLLANPVVQSVSLGACTPPSGFSTGRAPDVETVPLAGLDAEGLARLSRLRTLSLSVEEMRAIQAYFRGLRREPTDAELETLAQTWSEHCYHKTFKALIDFTHRDAAQGERREVINGLLRTYIMAATERANRPWIVSAFSDNAGVIDFDGEHHLAFKVETHNHPSALEPFGGANTGVGGVIRDVLGVSARPIANTDVLCFGPPDLPDTAVPPGVIHPRRMAEGVVAGIADYGNKIGLPTVNGAICYDPGFTANPLVYCGTVGLARAGRHPRQPRPGDAIVVIGGRTGRDGIHGATFSSAELTPDTAETVGSAVQIGDPVVEKKVLDALLRARDEGLYHAVTDCGAGGLASAVGEMGAALGARVELERVPLKYAGLAPWEIWLSEAQERMVLAVPPERLERLLRVCADESCEATAIGRFTDTGRLELSHAGRPVGDLDMGFLHRGPPRLRLRAVWDEAPEAAWGLPPPADLGACLLRVLADPNVASKHAVIRGYDHEVLGATVLKPLTGRDEAGPSDAAVLQPLPDSPLGVALGNGINPAYGALNPYWMAASAIDEAVRNVVAVGADLERLALLDNFCWGSPRDEHQLGALVRACQACFDVATAYGLPFISGKDSLNNEYHDPVSGGRKAIPPTLLISAIGIVPDVSRVTSSDLKAPGGRLYLLGETADELGGSRYLAVMGASGGRVPRVDAARARGWMERLGRALRGGLVRACHDCSEGGLAVAAAEMALGGCLGLALDLTPLGDALRDDTLLFSESNSRFLVEVAPQHEAAFLAALGDTPCRPIGEVRAEPRLEVRRSGRALLALDLADARRAWESRG